MFVTCRSARFVTSVPRGRLVLLVRFGSELVEVTVAIFVMVPVSGALRVKMRLMLALEARLPTFQFTMGGLPLVVPPLLALTKVTFVGNTSLATTLEAVAGPKFVTIIVLV